jgi:hypothetical protein
MKRLLLLALALTACGGAPAAPATCTAPADSSCHFKNTDGQFYKLTMTAYGLFPEMCACADWAAQ